MKPEERLAAAFDAVVSALPSGVTKHRGYYILENGSGGYRIKNDLSASCAVHHGSFESVESSRDWIDASLLAGSIANLEAAPGSDDLVDQLRDARQEVKDAIMDVMLGVGAESSRDFTGINSCIRFRAPPTLEQLVAWQARLEQALNKL